MTICDVANCPAAAVVGSRFCGVHKDARTAQELRLGPNKEGLGAATCAKCWRRFKNEDYVSRTPIERRVRAKTAAGWRHVSCSPSAPLARSRAAQIVGDVLAALDGHANEPLIVLLVAEELALLGVQGAAVAGGKEKALRQALSFVADVELRILKWLDASTSVLQLPIGRG